MSGLKKPARAIVTDHANRVVLKSEKGRRAVGGLGGEGVQKLRNQAELSDSAVWCGRPCKPLVGHTLVGNASRLTALLSGMTK
jgi:hypothetical protein